MGCLFTGIVFLGFFNYFFFNYPYPSESVTHQWEERFKAEVTPDISNFHGYWVDADIGAYIYGYTYSSPTQEMHKRQVIAALHGFNVVQDDEHTLVLRRPVRYYNPEGYDEWRFIFTPGTNNITVLYANLDSEVEMKQHDRLVERANQYHTKQLKRPNQAL